MLPPGSDGKAHKSGEFARKAGLGAGPDARLPRRRAGAVGGGPAPRLLACDLRDVGGDLLRLRRVRAGRVAGQLLAGAGQQVRGHAAVAGAADPDRAHDAGGTDRADVVEVRAGHAPGAGGLQRVAAPAVLAEEDLALVEVLVVVLLRGERAGRPLCAVLVGQDDRRNGDAERDVEDRDHDPEAAAALGQVGLAGLTRTARERD